MQHRLPKFRRAPEAVANRRLTDRSLAIIDVIHRHRILPTSLIVRLVPGNQRQTQQHLHLLFHRGLINRFTFPTHKNTECQYYLDNPAALDLLVEQGSDPEALDYEGVRRNKEKAYADINDPTKSEAMLGSLLFLQHEAMISRFHATLELACNQTGGRVVLAAWRQGASLWHQVEAPRLSYQGLDTDGNPIWQELDDRDPLPHRPDALFSLYYPHRDPERQWAHFFYEADRKTTNTTRHNRKLRAHFQFVVKQKLHELTYGIKRIRAVLIETLDDAWAETLRTAAAAYEVSGPKPTALFWFTTSRLFLEPQDAGGWERPLPRHLAYPEIIFDRIWATPAGDQLYSLLD